MSPSVRPGPSETGPALLGTSPPMRELRRMLERAAATEVPVLLLGETGTGKSVAARRIHAGGPRRSGPFVSVNCAALPDSLFESELFGHRRGAFTGAHEDRAGLLETAHRGTLLLDEVGDLPLAQQAKLLTVLEEGEVRPVGARRPVPVDVRVVAATASPLDRRVEGGTFRIDLFHRLALLTLRLPPLRERPGDLPALAEHFLARAALRHRVAVPELDAAVVEVLAAHPWPGNVRELAHSLEAALILAGPGGLAGSLRQVLGRGVAGVPTPPAEPPGARYSFYGTEDEERARIRDALALCHGNRTRAARELGMSRNTLRDRMRRYRL